MCAEPVTFSMLSRFVALGVAAAGAIVHHVDGHGSRGIPVADGVDAVAAVDIVGTATALEGVVTDAAVHAICAVSAVERVVTVHAGQEVVAFAAVERVVAAIALQGVVAAFAAEIVVSVVATQPVAVAGAFDGFDADEGVALGVAARALSRHQVDGDACTGPAVSRRVPTVAAADIVGAAAALDRVVAAAAEQNVVAAVAEHVVGAGGTVQPVGEVVP